MDILIGAVLLIALYVIAKIVNNEKNDPIEKVLYVIGTCIVAAFLILALWR
ncbi:MAG: hypothetical protein Q4D30_01130 [Bacteroidales bacterium]|nr:hypothetical protein [Bacteroidales bacterium]